MTTWTGGPGDASSMRGVPISTTPLADGEVYVYDAATGRLIPGTAGGSGWTTALDYDFTAVGNATIANGTNTIGGVSWFAENAAAASIFDVVSGTGLRMKASAAAASNYGWGLRSAPILTAPILTLCSLDWTQITNFRAMVYMTFTGGTDNEEGFGISMEAYSQEAGWAQAFASIQRIRLAGLNKIRIFNAAGTITADINDARTTTDDVYIMQSTSGLPSNWLSLSAPSVAGAITPANWRQRGLAALNLSIPNAILNPTSLAFTLAVRNGGYLAHADPLLATVKQIRIDYK